MIRTAVLGINAVWTFKCCQISFDKIFIFEESYGIFVLEIFRNFKCTCEQTYIENWKKKIYKFPQKFVIYQRKFRNAWRFIRRFFLARRRSPSITQIVYWTSDVSRNLHFKNNYNLHPGWKEGNFKVKSTRAKNNAKNYCPMNEYYLSFN